MARERGLRNLYSVTRRCASCVPLPAPHKRVLADTGRDMQRATGSGIKDLVRSETRRETWLSAPSEVTSEAEVSQSLRQSRLRGRLEVRLL